MNRIFSGAQPTGNLTLGNYLGAIKNWVALQDEYACIYGIMDLHSITVAIDQTTLYDSTLETAASYIACGLDPDKNILMQQSRARAHSEISWVFSTITPMGWMDRMTQFKDKAGKNKQKAGVGLWTYPILMAADILAYHATHVPVGDDQKQHLELCRNIATRFNERFEVDFFTPPEPIIMESAARIMSLRDGTKKMSKSDPSDLSRINLIDDADTIAKKIKKAKSDPDALPETKDGLEGRPEAENLLTIYSAMSGQSFEETVAEFAGKQFSDLKPQLADLLIERLAPIQAKLADLMADKAQIETILKDGTEKANALSSPIRDEIYKIVGFRK